MKTRFWMRTLLVVAVFCTICHGELFAQTIVKATIRPTANNRQLAKDTDITVGDVVVTLVNRKRLVLSKNHLASRAKSSPDRKTVAWIDGTVDTGVKPHAYYFLTVSIWRGGKIVAKLKPSLTGDVNWDFRDGGKKIAVRGSDSLGRHSISQLFDTETGKQIAGYDDRESPGNPPDWSKGL